jgi:hypothetical protein
VPAIERERPTGTAVPDGRIWEAFAGQERRTRIERICPMDCHAGLSIDAKENGPGLFNWLTALDR